VNLTYNFSLEELSRTDHREFDNTPPDDVIANLRRLALLLERVRALFNNRPTIISSGYRSLEVNRAVGSSDHSQHRLGCAADLRIPDQTPDMVVQAIIKSDIPFDQLIREFDSWTHISVPNHEGDAPRKQVLIIDKQGTRAYV